MVMWYNNTDYNEVFPFALLFSPPSWAEIMVFNRVALGESGEMLEIPTLSAITYISMALKIMKIP